MPTNHFFYFIFLSIPFLLLNALIQFLFSKNNQDFYVFFWLATGVVFISKFLFDKYVIYKSKDKIKKESIFYLYTSIATTLVSMFVEKTLIEHFNITVFFSACLSLIVGYNLKYILDYNYVFKKEVLL